MLYLVTGKPGSGKTALGLHRAFTLQKEGRTIYAHGIKDLDYEKAGFKQFPDNDPSRWEELPDGSVCIIDECYGTFPNRNASAKVPAHVEALARHRHRGFDFILIAQQGLQLDPFIRGLYESHEHVRKKIGRYATLKRWDSYQSNTNGHCSDKSSWVRPGYVFEYYTSTVLDTTKNRIPTWLKWLAILGLFVGGITYYLKSSAESKMEDARRESGTMVAGDAPSGAGARAPATSEPGKPLWETTADYATAHLPRFATMPWTAPVYDQRSITADPQLICMSADSGSDALGNELGRSCTCMTEQATSYDIGEAECRRIARQGPVYNPYRQTAAKSAHGAPVAYGGGPQPARDAPATSAIKGAQVSGYGDLGIALKPGP